ncbi:MAG TPA: amidase [Polyangiaceae bacterium]|nr:amidase [Polyangiaceae bacterium]
MTDELHRWTASELVLAYRRRKLSPVEVTRAVLDRISRREPELNAFVVLDPEAALADARASEARWSASKPAGLVDGVPVSVKDLLLARGWPTRCGSLTVSSDGPWEIDAPAVARLREHGAVLLGKTTTSEFGLKGRGDSPLSGVTRNPWQPAHTPGGSSAGAVTAVAAGFGPLAVGTDGGGSIRVPSAFTGVVGLKPTFGRVPTSPAAVIGVPPHVGPITRSVRDAALLLNVLSEPDARDPFRLPEAPGDFRDALGRSWKRTRIGVSVTLGHARVDPEIVRALERAALVFEDLGASVEAEDPPIASPTATLRTLFSARAAFTVRSLDDAARAKLDPVVLAAAREGEQLSALDYLAAEAARAALTEKMADYHCRFDLLLTPTTAEPAPRLDAAPEPGRDATPFAYPFSLTRQPAISVPVGTTRARLPIGLQIVGRPLEDGLVLAAADALEAQLGALRAPD